MNATGGLGGRNTGAPTFAEMVAAATGNQELWRAVSARTTLEELVAPLDRVGEQRRLLADGRSTALAGR